MPRGTYAIWTENNKETGETYYAVVQESTCAKTLAYLEKNLGYDEFASFSLERGLSRDEVASLMASVPLARRHPTVTWVRHEKAPYIGKSDLFAQTWSRLR